MDVEAVELLLSDWSYSLYTGATKEARKAIKRSDDAYFNGEIWLSVNQLVQMQAADKLRYVEI